MYVLCFALCLLVCVFCAVVFLSFFLSLFAFFVSFSPLEGLQARMFVRLFACSVCLFDLDAMARVSELLLVCLFVCFFVCLTSDISQFTRTAFNHSHRARKHLLQEGQTSPNKLCVASLLARSLLARSLYFVLRFACLLALWRSCLRPVCLLASARTVNRIFDSRKFVWLFVCYSFDFVCSTGHTTAINIINIIINITSTTLQNTSRDCNQH